MRVFDLSSNRTMQIPVSHSHFVRNIDGLGFVEKFAIVFERDLLKCLEGMGITKRGPYELVAGVSYFAMEEFGTAVYTTRYQATYHHLQEGDLLLSGPVEFYLLSSTEALLVAEDHLERTFRAYEEQPTELARSVWHNLKTQMERQAARVNRKIADHHLALEDLSAARRRLDLFLK